MHCDLVTCVTGTCCICNLLAVLVGVRGVLITKRAGSIWIFSRVFVLNESVCLFFFGFCNFLVLVGIRKRFCACLYFGVVRLMSCVLFGVMRCLRVL